MVYPVSLRISAGQKSQSVSSDAGTSQSTNTGASSNAHNTPYPAPSTSGPPLAQGNHSTALMNGHATSPSLRPLSSIRIFKGMDPAGALFSKEPASAGDVDEWLSSYKPKCKPVCVLVLLPNTRLLIDFRLVRLQLSARLKSIATWHPRPSKPLQVPPFRDSN
jgi:hypothetical protein